MSADLRAPRPAVAAYLARHRIDGVRSIVVLYPHPIGDFVFGLPALHALKHTYPEAELVLIGKQWQADFLHARPGPVDRVLLMPPYPGVGMAADARVDPGPARQFVDGVRAERFSLAVQLFGGGGYSNPFVMQLGADLCIGARAHDAPLLDRWVAYAPPASQRLIALEVAALAGASAPFPERELAVTDEDRRLAAQLLAPRAGERLVVVQPGVTDPRRRWPTERFAAVADMLAQEGAQIVVNGTAQEAPLVRAVVGAMRQPALDATGRLSLRGLCGLFERALLVLSNDTGPLHLALAIGTPCVGIFWFTNLINGAPLQPSRLRAALSARVHCPVCGAENIRYRCPHDDSFVADVGVDEVAGMALSLLHTSSAARGLPIGTAAAGSRA